MASAAGFGRGVDCDCDWEWIMTDQRMVLPPIELTPKDLSSWRTGNRGVDYVHTFDSGRPGPHVIVNALTHGNEFCGMIAVTHLLEQGIRPLRGKLTLSLDRKRTRLNSSH